MRCIPPLLCEACSDDTPEHIPFAGGSFGGGSGEECGTGPTRSVSIGQTASAHSTLGEVEGIANLRAL